MSELLEISVPGKIILFGEHSVVHGKMAIASSLEHRTRVTICTLEANHVIIKFENLNFQSDPLPKHLPEFVSNLENVEKSFSALRQVWFHLNLHNSVNFGILIKVSSSLPIGSGMGSSASFSVAMSAALVSLHYNIEENKKLQFLDVNSSEYKLVNELAFKCESIFHGTPSGIDNEICLRGGAVSFMRDENKKLRVNNIKISDLFRVIIVDTKKCRNTAKVVEDVKELLKKRTKITEGIMNVMHEVAVSASQYLEESKFEDVQELIRINQGLLYSIGVSHPLLETIGLIAAEFHLSWKLTGAGRGGNAFILIPEHFCDVEMLCDKLTKQGFGTYLAKLGSNGLTATWLPL